jgi:hypothetical protein
MKNQNQSQTSQASSSGRSTGQTNDFNFDTWAVEVRQQMMEALKRRGSV